MSNKKLALLVSGTIILFVALTYLSDLSNVRAWYSWIGILLFLACIVAYVKLLKWCLKEALDNLFGSGSPDEWPDPPEDTEQH